MANGGFGGANSRQLPRATPNSSFSWPIAGIGQLIDIIAPFGMGGNVGNVGSTTFDIAVNGGNATPIIVLQGGRRIDTDIFTTMIGSGGGDPFIGGVGQARRIYDFDEIAANNTGGNSTSHNNPETMADSVTYTIATIGRFDHYGAAGGDGSYTPGIAPTYAPPPAFGSGGGGRGAVIANNAQNTLYGGNGRDGIVIIYAYASQ